MMVFAADYKLYANLLCGKCGEQSAMLPVERHQIDYEPDILNVVCPKCETENYL